MYTVERETVTASTRLAGLVRSHGRSLRAWRTESASPVKDYPFGDSQRELRGQDGQVVTLGDRFHHRPCAFSHWILWSIAWTTGTTRFSPGNTIGTWCPTSRWPIMFSWTASNARWTQS